MPDLPLNLILVEDEPAHAEAICRAFRTSIPEARVRLAGSLNEFRAMLITEEPEVAILDMNLPDGSALDFLISADEAKSFPVVVMTSFGNEEVAVNAMKAGALEYIVKSPDAFQAMPRTISSVIREWKLLIERKSMEKKMIDVQKLQSLGALAGGIAHDFNNLLMSILGHADMALSKMPPDSPEREHVLEIATATRDAANLCGQMLAFSGKGKFIVETIELKRVIEKVAQILKTSVSKKAQLELNLADNLPAFAGDATQIGQVLMNLVINASEALDENAGVIKVSTGEFSSQDVIKSCVPSLEDLPPGHFLFVEVSDTGCGMTDEVISKIFDPFFTTKLSGRGLGMSAVIGIIKAHFGTLQINSVVGKGSKFKIILPVVENKQESILPQPILDTPALNETGTILMVDDEETLLAVGGMMLDTLGLKVLKARNGWDALQIFKEKKAEISCILLDLNMPYMDGEEAFTELRKLDPNVKIILASGFSEQEIEKRFAGKNLNGVLKKPYDLGSMLNVLARAIANIGV